MMTRNLWRIFAVIVLITVSIAADPIKNLNNYDVNGVVSNEDELIPVKAKNDGNGTEPVQEKLIKPKLNLANDPRFNKMLPNEDAEVFIPKPNISIGSDPRFNKMLPFPPMVRPNMSIYKKTTKMTTVVADVGTTSTTPKSIVQATTIGIVPIDEKTLQNDISHSEISKSDEEEYDEDDYYDDDDDEIDENDNDTETENNDDEKLSTHYKEFNKKNTTINEKIKTSTKSDVKTKTTSNKIIDNNTINEHYDDNNNSDDNDEEDDFSDDDIIEYNDDHHEIHLNKNCPRDCICEKNINSFMVATCNRLDAEIQKFDSSITDLQVVNIGPMYPIVLTDDFFKKIGLESIESIKITNCTIEEITENAFRGLNNLFSINLTNNGIETIHPDTFAKNLKLRLVSLAGNDLSNMQNTRSPYSKYMLKASSIEELDLSNCSLTKLLPTAFNELKNIVYINLSGNKLRTLPNGLFDRVDTIEELNLSNNLISSLPKMLFNKTSLAILHLQFNKLSTSLEFLTNDIQRLDLSYCKLTNINDIMFKGLDNLNYLVLKGNGLKKIHPAAFTSLKNLRHIDLSYNNFDQISSMIFLSNPNLDVIKLNNNGRLKKLPSEGFESATGQFKTYSLDVSNCDIKQLSDNTFSTMPELTILNLSGNKIEKLSKGIFSYLSLLIDLDLSNNFIEEFNDLIFLHNINLNKIKLSGNQMESLSSRTFLPTINLSELDVSSCGLNTIWTESSKKTHAIKILKNLRVLNISNNDIGTVFKSDLDIMTNLNVLDISNNPLNCDNEFRTLMKWLGKKMIKTSDPLSSHANLETSFFVEDTFESKWNALAEQVCSTVDSSSTEKDHKKNDENDDDDAAGDDNDDDDATTSDEYDYSDTDYYDSSEPEEIGHDNDKILDEGLIVTSGGSNKNAIENEKMKKTEKINEKLSKEIDLDELTKIEEELINNEDLINSKDLPPIEIRYSSYAHSNRRLTYTWIGLLIVLSLTAIVFIFVKVVSLVTKKRGERFQQALLAAKNSIVYQKLSEDVGPTTPKLHRYMPINQV